MKLKIVFVYTLHMTFIAYTMQDVCLHDYFNCSKYTLWYTIMHNIIYCSVVGEKYNSLVNQISRTEV